MLYAKGHEQEQMQAKGCKDRSQNVLITFCIISPQSKEKKEQHISVHMSAKLHSYPKTNKAREKKKVLAIQQICIKLGNLAVLEIIALK